VIIGAFFLYLVVFPLIGIGAGVFLRILLPYLFGGTLIHLLMRMMLVPTGGWWEYAIPYFAWASLLLGTRLIDSRRSAWHEGHWRSVLLLMSLGFWRHAAQDDRLVEELEFSPAESI